MLNLTEVGIKNDPTRNLRTRKLHANSQFSSIRKKLKVGDSYHDMEHCLQPQVMTQCALDFLPGNEVSHHHTLIFYVWELVPEQRFVWCVTGWDGFRSILFYHMPSFIPRIYTDELKATFFFFCLSLSKNQESKSIKYLLKLNITSEN